MYLRDPVVVRECPNQACGRKRRAYGVSYAGNLTGRPDCWSIFVGRLRAIFILLRNHMRDACDEHHGFEITFDLDRREYPKLTLRGIFSPNDSPSRVAQALSKELRPYLKSIPRMGMYLIWRDFLDAPTTIWLTTRHHVQCENGIFKLDKDLNAEEQGSYVRDWMAQVLCVELGRVDVISGRSDLLTFRLPSGRLIRYERQDEPGYAHLNSLIPFEGYQVNACGESLLAWISSF